MTEEVKALLLLAAILLAIYAGALLAAQTELRIVP